MKKILFFLVATMLLGVSCQQQDGFDEVSNSDVVTVTLNLDIPELAATRAGETDMNSGLGAIDNFTADEWEKYDVRYMMEIYEVTEGNENLDTPVKARDIQTLDEYAETMFEVRLVPNRDYRFVVWADIVEEGSQDDLHYNTTDLKNITRNNLVAMDECQDAYFIKKDLKVGNSGIEESLVLRRPFGKVRVITTDYDEVNIGSEPAKVEINFYNHTLYTSLNAVTGKASGETTYTYAYDVAKEAPYTQGYDAEENNMTLFADYILAGDEEEGAQEINFTITVWGKDGREINSHDFNTQIPLERNHLTTIVGNLLTLQNDITISIDDDFDGEYIREWDEPGIALQSWGVGEINDNGNYEFVVNDGTNEFSVVVPYNAVSETTGKLQTHKGAKFVATEADLDDTKYYETFTIKNFKVDPTRTGSVDATIEMGNMRVTNGGTEVYMELWYTIDGYTTENIRYEFKGDIVGKTYLAAPEVEAYAEGNTIYLSWSAVENADTYAVTFGTEMPVFTEELSYTYTGEYETEYTFNVVAVPADEDKYYPSVPSELFITTGSQYVERTVTVYADEELETCYCYVWDNEGTEHLGEWPGTQMTPNGDGVFTYTFGKEFDGATLNFIFHDGNGHQTEDLTDNVLTENLTFNINIIPDTTDTVIYFSAQHWEADGARFAVYYWNDNANNWADLTLAEGESHVYTVTIPAGYNNIIFCRMNGGTTENKWENKWNQTQDLVIPSDGSNFLTITNGWDGASGTWSVYTPAEEPTYTDYNETATKGTSAWGETQYVSATYTLSNDTWIETLDDYNYGTYTTTETESGLEFSFTDTKNMRNVVITYVEESTEQPEEGDDKEVTVTTMKYTGNYANGYTFTFTCANGSNIIASSMSLGTGVTYALVVGTAVNYNEMSNIKVNDVTANSVAGTISIDDNAMVTFNNVVIDGVSYVGSFSL